MMTALERALPELHEDVLPVMPPPADIAALERAHTPGHVERVRAVCDRSVEIGGIVRIDPDTPVSPGSWAAALAASGCGIAAVDAVLDGTCRAGFCAVRPPGHHATPDRAMGFCLFNHIAVAARHALARPEVERVLIVDWDVHHGNGTQDIFYDDPSVFFLSMHQHPLFPGTGSSDERGRGAGEGTTLNLPMPAGLPPERYVETLLDGVDRVLSRFEPDLTLISAGFDAGAEDPLGGFTLAPAHFDTLTHEVLGRTRGTARNRVVSFLEGGYNPDELGRNVVSHLTALRDATG
ncbi:MAG: histone deacetylase [Gemmatimonadales bacterium]|nr:histone deacetylase [Gemmatimonadales bacterium]MXX79049.1 histone deacetylase [Gemmatimonadales bacterium]MYC86951.1 histone deacetylase [Candidatus Palauibacter denitrificans]